VIMITGRAAERQGLPLITLGGGPAAPRGGGLPHTGRGPCRAGSDLRQDS